MIDANSLNAQRLSNQSKKNDISFFTYGKTVMPYIAVGFVFECLSKYSILLPPETVVWAASKTFEILKWAALTAGAAHAFWVYSPYSQAPKPIRSEKKIEVLQAENIRLRQALAARQKVMRV